MGDVILKLNSLVVSLPCVRPLLTFVFQFVLSVQVLQTRIQKESHDSYQVQLLLLKVSIGLNQKRKMDRFSRGKF